MVMGGKGSDGAVGGSVWRWLIFIANLKRVRTGQETCKHASGCVCERVSQGSDLVDGLDLGGIIGSG